METESRRHSEAVAASGRAGDGDGSCLVRLRQALTGTSDTSRRIARFVLDRPDHARGLAVTALAEACGVSQSSLSRFCRVLGYAGYRAFQLDLAAALADNGVPRLDRLVPGQPSRATVAHVFEGNRATLNETEKLLDTAALLDVAARVEKARRVYLLGWGASGLMARYGAQRLLSVGLGVSAIVDPYDQLFAMASVGRGDVVVGISHSGETAGVVEGVRAAHGHGAYTAALTNYTHSRLAAACDARLITAFREHRLSAALSSSHVAQMSVLDALYFLVAAARSRDARRMARETEIGAQELRRHKTRRRPVGRAT